MVSQEQAADSWGGVVGSGCPQFLSGAPGTEGGGPAWAEPEDSYRPLWVLGDKASSTVSAAL